MSVISREAQADDVFIIAGEVANRGPGAISRTVVHEDDFVRPERLTCCGHTLMKQGQNALLVVAGGYDRYFFSGVHVQSHVSESRYQDATGIPPAELRLKRDSDGRDEEHGELSRQ